MVSRERLLQILVGVLDCQNHYHRPNLKRAWRDKDFRIDFDKAIVVCEQCVDRMRKALELEDGQHPLDTKVVDVYADYETKETNGQNGEL
jgi:hypothetical protein